MRAAATNAKKACHGNGKPFHIFKRFKPLALVWRGRVAINADYRKDLALVITKSQALSFTLPLIWFRLNSSPVGATIMPATPFR